MAVLNLDILKSKSNWCLSEIDTGRDNVATFVAIISLRYSREVGNSCPL